MLSPSPLKQSYLKRNLYKPYEDFLGMHLLFGVIVIGVAGVFIDPPQAPDEKAEPQIQEEKEEERRRLMDDDRQDYSTTVSEPESSIWR